MENLKNKYKELIDEGQRLYNQKEYKEAIKRYKLAYMMYKKQIEKSELSSLYIRLANAYYSLEDTDKSTYYYEEYLKNYPQGQTSVFSRLAHAYYYIDTDTSIDYHNKALNSEVNRYDVSCKLFAMTKSSYYDQQDIKDESEHEIEILKNSVFKDIKKYSHENKKKYDGKRKLNIGYLSSDCHAHTMMNYILPIWENHDKEKFNFFIFNGSEKNDTTTEKIIQTGFEIIPCAKKTDEEIAKIIYDKKTDILIDLGGFTHLKVFCEFYKPAPIIISYLGYLNTLGMKEVDYILTDRYTIPAEKACLYTEKPLYLDKGYQIFSEKSLPQITESPYKTNGYITYGSFNCTSKFSDATLYLWSEILKNDKKGKLLIYRTKLTKRTIRLLKEKFAKLGIEEERIIYSSKKYNPHYKAYLNADISLDPYPFSGMSIAIETALMGVPTVTMEGEGMQSRGASRINNVIGLCELNSTSGSDYVKNAIELGENKAKLDDLRLNLRKKVNTSALRIEAKEFTKDLEEKYTKAWEEFLKTR